MKEASAELVAHLAAVRMLRCADLIKITLADGVTSWRYCNRDADLSADGFVWVGGTPIFERSGTRRTLGIEVGTMALKVTYRDTDMLGAVRWSRLARTGVLDGASISVRRGYWEDWASPAVGTLHVFDGRVSDLDGGAPELRITLRSETELFDARVPRSIYQAGCRNVLYDALTCKATRTDVAFVAGSGATRVRITTGLTHANDHFTGGVIRCLTGANAGQRRSVKRHRLASGELIVAEPWLLAPASGDQFVVAAGCDYTRSTCSTKFNNAANFRGEPYVPTPETTL